MRMGQAVVFLAAMFADGYSVAWASEVPTTGLCVDDADCDDNDRCTVNYCEGGRCVIRPILHADINFDGFVSANK